MGWEEYVKCMGKQFVHIKYLLEVPKRRHHQGNKNIGRRIILKIYLKN